MSRNLRETSQRKIILEELSKVTTHPTANEIYEMVRKRLPRISLGTVYRNLELLSKSGLIQKLEVAGTQKRFDGIAKNHYHIKCVRCGRLEDLDLPALRSINEAAISISNYEVMWHRLEFAGLCPECRSLKLGVKSAPRILKIEPNSHERRG